MRTKETKLGNISSKETSRNFSARGPKVLVHIKSSSSTLLKKRLFQQIMSSSEGQRKGGQLQEFRGTRSVNEICWRGNRNRSLEGDHWGTNSGKSGE